MNEPRPSVTRLVRAIVRAELGRAAAADATVAARVMARLYEGLGRLIGEGGFDVLLARSVVLARRAHPALVGVTAGPRGTFVGLDVATPDSVALEDGMMAVLGRFIEILVVLIGEDLAMAVLVDMWPGAMEEKES
jgi:hypothetical protein